MERAKLSSSEVVILTVKQPYADLIVSGRKVWEIRRQPVRYRGEIVIVSDGKALGKAEIVDVKGPFELDELMRFSDKHFADREFLEAYGEGRPLWAWVIRNAERFERPMDVEIISRHEGPLRRGRLGSR